MIGAFLMVASVLLLIVVPAAFAVLGSFGMEVSWNASRPSLYGSIAAAIIILVACFVLGLRVWRRGKLEG